MSRPILSVADLKVGYGHGRSAVEVLHGIDMQVEKGAIVGLVGESGSGKSTLAKAIMGLIPTSDGTVMIDAPPPGKSRGGRRQAQVQLIPQDPSSSLNPRRTIGYCLAEAIDPVWPRAKRDRAEIVAALEAVQLDRGFMERYPHELSGGQRQRVAVARALIPRPALIVADEITSALDVSVQAEVLRLVSELHRERGFAMLFITHNLAVVEYLCSDVAVLRRGEVVESGPVDNVFGDPKTGYTRELLNAVPGSPSFTID